MVQNDGLQSLDKTIYVRIIVFARKNVSIYIYIYIGGFAQNAVNIVLR